MPLHPLTAAVITTGSDCSLVDAIRSANRDLALGGCPTGEPGLDTIVMTRNELLTEPFNQPYGGNANGLPKVRSPIEILGNGFEVERDSITSFRVFEISPSGFLTLRDATVRGGGAGPAGGGGFRNFGTVVLDHVTVTGNGALGGGGLEVTGIGSIAIVDHSTFTNNGAGVDISSAGGGAIETSGFLLLTNSTLSDNSSEDRGGALKSSGNTIIINTTIANNEVREYDIYGGATRGGGIYSASGEMIIINSTISGNKAIFEAFGGDADGGGLHVSNALLVGTTVADNFPDGVHAGFDDTITLVNTILSNSPDDCTIEGGELIDGGGNFGDDSDCPWATPITGLDPELADNGGPTLTHRIFPDSNAIDAGGDCGTVTDQRGFVRNGACDSGSFELGAEVSPPLLLEISGTCPGEMTTTVSNGAEGELVRVVWAARPGLRVLDFGPCQGTPIALEDLQQGFSTTLGVGGVSSVTETLDVALCGFSAQAVSSASCSTSDVVTLPSAP